MPEQLTNMSGEEFLTKILAGERDFRRIHLEHGYRLSIPAVSPTQEYIYNVTRDRDQVREYSLDLSGSDLSGIRAIGLFFPYLTAVETDFKFANLSSAQFYEGNLRKANFFGANLGYTTFFRANLAEADFSRAKLDSAGFEYADLAEVNFHQADLRNTDLRGRNLESAEGLESAHFFETKINDKDEARFAKIIKKRKFFVSR